MAQIIHSQVFVSVNSIVRSFNLWFERTAGPETELAAEDANTSIEAAIKVPLQNLIAASARLECLKSIPYSGPGGKSFTFNWTAVPGLRTGNALPANSPMIMNFTNSGGLLKRPGRIFISGVSKDEIFEGFLTSAFRAVQCQTFFDAIETISAAGGSTWEGRLIVLRHWINKIQQIPPVVVPIDGFNVAAAVGTRQDRKGLRTGITT